MSMNGQFVQVAPGQLARLLDDPDEIEGLFMTLPPASNIPAGAMERLANLAEAQRKQFIERGPKMLEEMLARMDPRMRDEMSKRFSRLGLDTGGLGKGEGGEALLKLMAARAKSASGGGGGASGQGASQSPNAAGASLSIEKAWHGIHFLLCGAAEPTTTLISNAIMGGHEIGDDFSGYGPARYFAADETAAMATELNRRTLESEMTARYNPAQMTTLGIYPNGWSGPDAQWLMREFRRVRDFYADASAKGFAIVTCLV
jgi:hypothetical protein